MAVIVLALPFSFFLYPSSPCFVASLYTGRPFWVLHDFLCAKLASPDDIGKYRDAISGESSNGCSANFLLKFLAVVILWGLLFIAQRKVYTQIGNADEVKKSSFAGDGLKKKSLPLLGVR